MPEDVLSQREAADDIMRTARDRVLAMMQAVPDVMLDNDRLIFGDIKLDRPERILSILDKQERGVLRELRRISPDDHAAILRQLDRDLAAEGIDLDMEEVI